MKKILVTGNNGFLASRFIEFYKDKYDIMSFNKNDLDISNEFKVYNIFKENKFDIVVHLAAISDTGKCQGNPTLAKKINLQGTINIAKGCEMKKSTLVFASSDQIYAGNKKEGPYSEDIIIEPNNVYAESKFNAENEIKNILDNYYNLRLTWLFSMAERNKKVNTNIITNILNAALKKQPLNLSINEFRGMTYVYEVIENFEKLIEIPFGDYNYGSENNLSTYEIGTKVLEHMGLENRDEDIIIKDSERFKDKKRDLRISNRKLNKLNINFSDTEEAIQRCIQEFKF
ncbi:sugar nucleotide-binding protein [Clostridium sp. D53t1_180928_C8]|uniref:SDR family oxidoreductase n=1 Tax=Clostridium sp. D53t1_180928_C8 TaxID=2787101 RepID=UPI0018AA4F31|nr:sugar nucleotide-binding protein [Clostridium sp. D53t1_180928_C8]